MVVFVVGCWLLLCLLFVGFVVIILFVVSYVLSSVC